MTLRRKIQMTKDTDQIEPKNIDALYDEAVVLVLNSRHLSYSYLQRHFRLGYSDTRRLIAKMEANGIDHRISVPEKTPAPLSIQIVLIDIAGSRNMKALIAKKHPGIEFIIIDSVS